ncbi:MAG: ParB/RepB/Spo0J family partition protein [Alphaproteobacteria bacterium]|nr:ParB/RepB/Spo0J family partition protein [Alphaproteobacteria bacterium]
MTAAGPSRLGRGLSALLGETQIERESEAPARPARTLAIAEIEPNPHQPRRRFGESELEELAASIRLHGVLQPIVVRPHPKRAGRFEIVAGERRWRAAGKAGLHELPVIVKELTDSETLEIALVENIQRADLNPLDEARAFKSLVEEFGHKQEAIGEHVGKSRAHVANTMRLLNLPTEVQEMIAEGRLTAGQARPLIGNPRAVALAEEALAKGWSARAVEEAVRAGKKKPAPKSPAAKAAEKDADTRALERNVAEALGLEVEIDHKGETGRVLVRYSSLEQLDEICRRLSRR